MTTSIFSRIIAGELPCAKVYEDELGFAFMDAGQVNPGHVIVASKAPFETLMDADEATAQAMTAGMLRAASGQVPDNVVNREVLDRPGFRHKLARFAENT